MSLIIFKFIVTKWNTLGVINFLEGCYISLALLKIWPHLCFLGG